MSYVLEVNNLMVELGSKILVNDMSFSVSEGKCLGILGESGSGKSTISKALTGLLDNHFRVSGQVIFNGYNLLDMHKESIRKLLGNEICMILQNPMTSLNPLYRVGEQIAEGLIEHKNLNKEQRFKKCLDILGLMKIRNPEEVLRKYPHQLSGGMLQRIMIGMALIMKPKLIIADEPTTAIDSITQYEIIKEFQRIKEEYKVALIFISHDLAVVSKLADEVIVIHDACLHEQGTMDVFLSAPSCKYTNVLVENKIKVANRFHEVMNSGRGM